MKTLFLSIGHDWGNKDQGASANGTTEAIEAKHVIDDIIAKGIQGIELVKVPEGLTLVQRIAWINKNIVGHAEPFAMELHLDAGPSTAQGASAWYKTGNDYTLKEGKEFLAEYTRITGETSRHVNPDSSDRLGRLAFVQDTKCASLLIELGFITNANELAIIRKKAVVGVIGGIMSMNK